MRSPVSELTEADARRWVAAAGYRGDTHAVSGALEDVRPMVRAAALGSLRRLGALDLDVLRRAFDDIDPVVRRRAAELAATEPALDLVPVLADDDAMVVEMAAWACGEHADPRQEVIVALAYTAGGHPEPLAREAAVAALGAIGAEESLPVVLAALGDKPPIRRRAVIALAAYDGPEVEAALRGALTDRDWQVRQAAEELLRITETAGTD